MKLCNLFMAAFFQIGTITQAVSGPLFNSSYGDFSVGLNVENESDLVGIFSIAMTLEILDSNKKIEFSSGGILEDISFFFYSGQNTISDQRVTRPTLEGLPEEIAETVMRQPTNTEECYIQGFTVGKQKLVVSVHNELNRNTENVYRCFSAAVWYFKFGNIDEFDAENWRRTLAGLIGHTSSVLATQHSNPVSP
ncbi:hypothetical protein [Ruegeria atlantica]|uniref:hypothetical protein n=1 Tax=Ruegeria atlantica TaxID=81569 RepID=UPI00147B80B7|nr:hypothetical protein [Ruegeria atlantica]